MTSRAFVKVLYRQTASDDIVRTLPERCEVSTSGLPIIRQETGGSRIVIVVIAVSCFYFVRWLA